MYRVEFIDMFPANAGMNRLRGEVDLDGVDVPRKRGDEPNEN